MNKNKKHINKESFLAQWIAGDITNDELKELVSKSDFLAYKKLKKGLEVYEGLEQSIDKSFKKVKEKLENQPITDPKKAGKVKKLYINWAASIAASFVLFFALYNYLGSDSILNKTNIGESRTIALLDGSEVILNAKSELNYSKNNWNDEREVFLNGEAFFKVKKGSKFTVKTKNGDITVLGTQFNVNSNNDFFEVYCYSGKVEVTNNDKKYILNPNNGFRKISDAVFTDLSSSIKSPTWITGESSFKSMPIKYVISALEKQYDVDFDSSKIDKTIVFTGSFTHKNLDIALASVFKAIDIKYNLTNAKKIVLTKK
jgi:ferric-dicitrate binding protein FerR (iron transport regulator)